MKKKSVVPKIVEEKKPKTKYVSPIKDYAITFDATVEISQNGLESCLPFFIKTDKAKYQGLSKEEAIVKIKEEIKQAIIFKCPWVKKVVTLDNVKFAKSLLTNE